MKITRLKSGYRIKLSDSDFVFLSSIVEAADDCITDDSDLADAVGSSTPVRAAYTRRRNGGRLMRVDEDRR